MLTVEFDSSDKDKAKIILKKLSLTSQAHIQACYEGNRALSALTKAWDVCVQKREP